MAAFCVHLPNQIKPKRPERIANVIEWHPQRKRDLGQSFQIDGTQVILNYIEIVEVEKNGSESEAKKAREINDKNDLMLKDWKVTKEKRRPSPQRGPQ